jgi:hypothetical protein
MARFSPKKIVLSEINGGNEFSNGDGISAIAINAPIEAAAFLQTLATNPPNVENIGNIGVPSVSIEELPDGGARFVFSNLKEKDYSQDILDINGKISRNEKRITNLEQGLMAEAFETDASTAYVKYIPANTCPYAVIGKVGGMTKRKRSANLIPYPYTMGLYGGEDEINILDNGDGSITLDGECGGYQSVELATVTLPKGTYHLSGFDEHLFIESDGEYGPYYSGETFTVDSKTVFRIVVEVYDGDAFSNAKFYPMLNVGDVALPFEPFELEPAPVTEVEILDRNLFDDNIFSNFGFAKLSEHEYFNNNLAGVLEKGAIFTNVSGASGSFTISTKTFYKNVGTASSGLFVKVTYTDGTVQELPAANKIQGEWFDYIVSTNAEKVLDYICLTFGSSAVDTTFKNFQIAQGSVAEFTPYTKRALSIPEAVRNLDGYGWGINADCYNYIDWENKQFVKRVGKVDMGTLNWVVMAADTSTFRAGVVGIKEPAVSTERGTGVLTSKYPVSSNLGYTSLDDKSVIRFQSNIILRDSAYTNAASLKSAMSGVMLYYELAKPIITDISNLITDDNLIGVQGGGTITMVNENQYAVPSEIIYQLKGVAE